MFQDVSVIPDIPAAKSQIDPLAQAADVLFKHKDFTNLKKIAANILERDSKNIKAIFYLSKYFEKENLFASQEKCLEKLMQLDLSAEHIFEYANFLYLRNRLDEAIQIIQENIQDAKAEDEKDFFNLYRLMGNIALKSSDSDTAEEYYNICLRLNPDSDVIYTNLGSLHLHKSNLSPAIAMYEKAVRINSRNGKAWMGLALCHLLEKDSQLFWGNIQNALECDPMDSKAVQIALDQALADFEYDLAVKAAETYLQQNPFDISISIRFVSLLFQVGQLDKAHLEVTKLLSFDPKQEDAVKLFQLIEAEYDRMANKR